MAANAAEPQPRAAPATVIGLTGATRCGKSRIAAALKAALVAKGVKVVIVGQDAFWERAVKVRVENSEAYSQEEPECTNHARFAARIRSAMEECSAGGVVIAEGFQLLHSAEVQQLYTHTFLIEIEHDEARARRTAAVGARNPNPLSAHEFDALAWPAHQRHLEKSVEPPFARTP